MSQLSPLLEAELKSDAPLVFGAISIDLPGYALNLLDGAGTLTFGGRSFVGDDATFGSLSDIDSLADGGGDNAPALSVTLIPNGDAAAAALCAPNMQGSAVAISLGAVNKLTGQVIDTMLIFVGELDVPTLNSNADGRTVDYEIVSVFERLFDEDESTRLSAGSHRSIFAGEAGLDFVTGVDVTVPWGVAGSTVVTSYSGGTASNEYYS